MPKEPIKIWKWQPKVTAIMESKDLDSMPLATLFGKLQEHEMELGHLTMHEDSDRKKKGITSKATTISEKKDNEQDDDSDSDLDDETMGLLVRKFNRYLKKKGGFKKFQKKDARESTKKDKNSKDRITCHECGKVGHIKYQSPTHLKKVDSENSALRDFKSKKSYIVWDVPEEGTTSSTSSEEESAKICLMARSEIAYDTSKTEEVSEVDDFTYNDERRVKNNILGFL